MNANENSKQTLRIFLLSFQKDSNAIMQKYMPNHLGSDAFKAEMMALVSKYVEDICDSLDIC